MNSTTSRVAHRYAAELLTKEWLMGVRRGWLKLVNPPTKTWADVHRAIAQLQAFVRNLRDEIFYIRQGPYTGSPTMREGQRVAKLLDELESTLKEAKSQAQFWEDVYEGRSLPGFTREQAEQSLRGWTTEFEDAISASIQGTVTKILDKVLKLLRGDAKRIREHDKIHPDNPYKPREEAYKEFSLGKMKVIIDDRTVTALEIKQYVKLFDKVSQVLKRKGFGKIWYGEIFVKCEKCGGENQYGTELGVAGHYHIGPNTITVYERPSESVVSIVIHELGHRWWFKHMSRENRLRFEDWIENGLSPVSSYGGKHFSEAFAEAFMYYVLGKKMTPQQVETFKLVAFGRRFSAAYDYDRRRFAKQFELSWYGLEGMTKGSPVKLYHGSTKTFRRFDLSKSREELVKNYYGAGIFLTPSKRVAVKYAEANRNMGFDPSIIKELKSKNPNAGAFLEALVREGDDAWDTFPKEQGFIKENPEPGEAAFDVAGFDRFLGVDPNDLGDIAPYILGSKVEPLGGGGPVNIFSQSTGLPDYVYDQLDKLGIDSTKYRPKVYTVVVTVKNPLITARKSEARKARSKGYDSVVFYGSDLVDGVPEVAVFNPRNVKVQKYEVV